MAVVDFTNPAAVRWWQGHLTGLLEDGVAVFKTDFAEAVPPGTVRLERRERPGPAQRLHAAVQRRGGRGDREGARLPAGLGRSSYLGGQRHAAQWGGDPASTYGGMGSTLRGGLSYAISGGTFWSHDVGGFYGSPSPDLYLRWAWFGALSPLNRYHGNTSRLPWDQAEGVYPVTRQIVATRYRLLPYLYSAAVEAVREHRTWLRPTRRGLPGRPGRAGRRRPVPDRRRPAGRAGHRGRRRAGRLPARRDLDRLRHPYSLRRRPVARLTRPPEQAPLFVRRGALLPVDPAAGQRGRGPGRARWRCGRERRRHHRARGPGRDPDRADRLRRCGRLTVTGPAPLTQAEWPRDPGEEPPGQVTVNGQPLDRRRK